MELFQVYANCFQNIHSQTKLKQTANTCSHRTFLLKWFLVKIYIKYPHTPRSLWIICVFQIKNANDSKLTQKKNKENEVI